MSNFPLTESYVDTADPKNPTQDITLYELFDRARRDGYIGEIINLESGERMTNLDILNMVSMNPSIAVNSCIISHLSTIESFIYV